MYITVANRPAHGATVVALHGDLGVDSAPQLRTLLTDLIDRSTNRIVVDLGPLVFCDSIGLSAFVDAHHRCARAGGYLRLAAAAPFLRQILAVVGLLGPIAVYDTVPAACAGDTSRLTMAPDSLRRPR